MQSNRYNTKQKKVTAVYIAYIGEHTESYIRGGADCTALPQGNNLYYRLKLKREEELTTKLKYLNKYGGRQ